MLPDFSIMVSAEGASLLCTKVAYHRDIKRRQTEKFPVGNFGERAGSASLSTVTRD